MMDDECIISKVYMKDGWNNYQIGVIKNKEVLYMLY